METTLNNGFCEMSQDETMTVDGGVAPLVVFLGKAAFAGVCWGLGYLAMDKIID